MARISARRHVAAESAATRRLTKTRLNFYQLAKVSAATRKLEAKPKIATAMMKNVRSVEASMFYPAMCPQIRGAKWKRP